MHRPTAAVFLLLSLLRIGPAFAETTSPGYVLGIRISVGGRFDNVLGGLLEGQFRFTRR